jgi:hypothetical protein
LTALFLVDILFDALIVLIPLLIVLLLNLIRD